MRDRIHRFISGLALELTEACTTTALHDTMDISMIQAFTQNIERSRRRQQGTERTEQGQHKRMRFPRYDRYTQSGPGESSRVSVLQRHRGSRQTWSFLPRCDICGRGHLGQCRASSDAYYTCGHPGHMMQDCPNRDSGGMAQPASSAIGSSMSMHPSGRKSQSSTGRGRGRGRGSNSGVNQNCIYALAGRQD
ncbi:uncharacterized protein [Nicotiana tomentosiformis]|uniref:uncharacterized protein n=1 Tax=Nicotiana tomentosiformis TaxID=4098 RepID=UPI00388C8082